MAQAPGTLIDAFPATDNRPEWVALCRNRQEGFRFSAMIRPPLAPLAAAVLLLSTTACRRDEVRTYVVAKETAAPAAANASAAPAPAASMPALPGPVSDATMANTAVSTAAGPGLAWDVPAGWTTGPEKPMRKATLLLPATDGTPAAELAVTAFPGDVGGNLANVNRWRGQLSLPPIGQAELGSALQHIDVGSLHIDVIELVGPGTPPAQRLLGAIVPYSGATWFFKLSGPDAAIAAQKDAFLAFVRTIRPSN